ncbi:MAG: hypothetical protein AAF430_16500 [Myxococcota bacterium]
MDSPTGSLLTLAIAGGLAAMGVRVLAAAWARERAPEVGIGVFFIALGAEIASYPLSLGQRGLFNGLAVSTSCAALLMFTYRVFRPGQILALAFAWGCGLVVASLFIVPHLVGWQSLTLRLAWALARSVALVWATFECARYYLQMRRRLQLGLADPVTANRFLLWSLWIGAAAMLPLSGVVIRLLALQGQATDVTVTTQPEGGVLLFAAWIFGWLLVALVALWLSFFPPERYLGWVRRTAVSGDLALGTAAPRS